MPSKRHMLALHQCSASLVLSEGYHIKAPGLHPADATFIILLICNVNKVLCKMHEVNILHWLVADEDVGDVSRLQGARQKEALASCILLDDSIATAQEASLTGNGQSQHRLTRVFQASSLRSAAHEHCSINKSDATYSGHAEEHCHSCARWPATLLCVSWPGLDELHGENAGTMCWLELL